MTEIDEISYKLNSHKIEEFENREFRSASFKYFSTFFLSPNKIPATDLSEFLFDATKSAIKNPTFVICNEITKRCSDVSFIPNTKTIVMTTESFGILVESSEPFIRDVATTLNVKPSKAIQYITEFFEHRPILVQQTGIEGFVYKMGTFIQSGGSTYLLARTIALAKLTGVSGWQIIQAQPFFLIALPTVGAIFFYGAGTLAGPNVIGKTCNSIGNKLNLPMKYVELVTMRYISPIIHFTTGIFPVFNFTDQVKRGPGLNPQEALNSIGTVKSKTIYQKIVPLIKKIPYFEKIRKFFK